MSDRTAPWFKFYPADFMNGVRGMSAQEVGLYQMLLCLIYEENGPVEFNVLRLATYCGMREATFTKTVEKLIALGKLNLAEGMLSNDRAEIEISSRANDLKNASKAGKASAKKRQQNQQADATPVQQAFNHTDTDTDTDKKEGGGGSACEREAVPDPKFPQQDPADREQILAAMGVGPDGVVGPSKFIGGQGDMAEARRWLELPGLTLPAVLDELRRITAGKPDGPASSFKYFTPAMQRLSGQLTAAPLQPTAGQGPRASPTRSVQPDIAAIMSQLEAEGRA
ncbi:DUF1376 domain-containing protein [Pseudogemmobacter faecipullorum]|uniref:DUF1376 domain-containing protein n=1 Tax=Pseudogemmobacter faecipullorum TaxID=2755041 RepID=A0ABS8CQX1_9RHOB|nr:DUF1376 domain-containing protein [Pseudogemmobacter faecipullorum]MCB5411802.1 DUF1376 domain-containing protein [Pseudogemmobacter faecipullorum]